MMRVTTLRDTELDLLTNNLTLMEQDKKKNIEVMKSILEIARSQIRTKMIARPYEEVQNDWMMTITKIYGLDAIKEKVENAKKSLKTTDENTVLLAVYKSLTYSAIIALEEFLKFINEHEKNDTTRMEQAKK